VAGLSTTELFDELERRSPVARSAGFDGRVREIVAHVQASSPAWRTRMAEAGIDPATVRCAADLPRIPVLSKAALHEAQVAEPPFGGFLAGDIAGLRLFMSPGPIYEPVADDGGGFARGFFAAGLRRGDLVLNTFSYHLTPGGYALEAGALALGATVIPAGVGNTELAAGLLAALPVTGYAGLPSYLATLLGKAPEVTLRRAVVGAEKLTEVARSRLEERVETVRQLYGTADVGYLAGECREANGLHVTEDKLVTICEPSTGEPLPPGKTGEVVVTTFSPTWPLLRFGTGDLSAVIPEDGCPCGRTSPRLVGVLGRVGPGVKVRGMFVYDHHATAALEGRRGRLVVGRTDGQDTLTFEVEGDVPAGEAAAIAERFRAAAKLRVEIVPAPAGSLPADTPPLVDSRRWDES